VNKADGDLAVQAMRTRADYAGALRLMRRRAQDPDGYPMVATVSAVTGAGLPEAWEAVTRLADWRRKSGVWEATRRAQARHWFHEELREEILARIAADAGMQARMAAAEADVAAGRLSPAAAAGQVLEPVFRRG
jgi:LAO/AO transport system kinase